MKYLSSADIRRAYLHFFEQRGHTIVPSSSLIPGNDPTLLFANSGMVQFKDTFLGLEQRPYSRATTSQKCLRVSGKHNDLEEVGPSPRHHTFFEMLGNFSFGDYFKSGAIPMAWELLTKVFELPVERLWFTVYEGDAEVPEDQEAANLWIAAGADPDRVLRFGRKDNFWVMADTGPCGPCSEITMYIGDDLKNMGPHGVNSDDPDYVEIWNNVFMQFERSTMQPLPRPSVDTGMGLERMAMVMQGVQATYDTDGFVPIIERAMGLLGSDRAHYLANFAKYRAVADHSRSVAFLITDGVLPGNNGRSYVLRRILRRAVYQGRSIGFDKPFLSQTVDQVISMMGDAYPDLQTRRQFILETVENEEQQFLRTLSGGIVRLGGLIEQVKAAGGNHVPGADAFTLRDTFGFPLDLTQKIASEHGLTVDEAGYDAALEEQRERSRKATQFKRGADAEIWADLGLAATSFTGYTALDGAGSVLAMVSNGDTVSAVSAGQQVQVVLDATPFYAESGGQVGDTGVLRGAQGRILVSDTLRPVPGVIVHYGMVEEGTIAVGERLESHVDALRRQQIIRNHTATHLLHRALRDTLGEHAAQAGSLVSADRLRFDFTHTRQVSSEQLRELERRINTWVRADTTVEWGEFGYQEALDKGAMALFGEKYGDRVRMVTVGCDGTRAISEDWKLCSRELCGGVHVGRTGEIGYFRILSESGVAAGVRRIEAITGSAAEQWVEDQANTVRTLTQKLGVPGAQLSERLDALLSELRQSQRALDELKATAARGSLEELLAGARTKGDIRFIAARVEADDPARLRDMGDYLRDKLGSGVVVLGAVLADKVQLLAMATADMAGKKVHAGNLIKAIAPIVEGSGGGRPDMAQAGGRNPAKLDEALAMVAEIL
jgi:alanyl-tRNA synthetase